MMITARQASCSCAHGKQTANVDKQAVAVLKVNKHLLLTANVDKLYFWPW